MTDRGTAAGGRLEFQKQNLWVGLFVIVATIAFVLVAAFAVQERVFRREYRLTTSFPGIGGLKPGAEVFLRGFSVGRVTKIDLLTSPDVRFDVEFTVKESVKLPAGTRVRLSMRGFGNKVLDVVTPGDTSDPEAPALPPPGRPVIYLADGASVPGSSGSDLDSLMGDVLVLTRRISATAQHLDTMMAQDLGPKLGTTLASVNEKIESVGTDLRATLADARTLMGQARDEIAESRPRVTRLLDGAGKEIESADALTLKAGAVMATFQGRLEPLLGQFSESLKRVDEITRKLGGSVNEEDLKATLAHLKTMSEKGDLLMTELQKRPWRLLRRVKGEKADLMKELESERRAREAATPAPAGEETHERP
jgi:ABC-type transporter Mla subunit MlaD